MNHHVMLWIRHRGLVEGMAVFREPETVVRMLELCTVYTVHNPNFFKMWRDNEQTP